MAVYQLRTFKDIQDAIMETMKIQATDTVSRNRIKRDINQMYEEINAFKNWPWLRGQRQLQVEPYYSSGTASASTGSNIITLSSTIAASKRGYLIGINGHNEVYRIANHVAGTAVIQLETAFSGSSGSTFSYKIWSDVVPLPTDARETTEVRHEYSKNVLESYGLQEFRRIVNLNPKSEGRPFCYTTTDWEDPANYDAIASIPSPVSRSSSGLIKTLTFASAVTGFFTVGNRIEITNCADFSYNGEHIVASVSGSTISYTGTIAVTEGTTADVAWTVKLQNTESFERYRKMVVYPAISDKRTVIHVDYIKSVPPLDNDDDEPVIPMQHRAMLLNAALSLAWTRERDPEESNKSWQIYQQRLAGVAAKTEDSVDKPVMRMSRTYLQAKRFPVRTRIQDSGMGSGGGSGGGSSASGSPNTLAIFNNLGDLQGSSTITVDEAEYLNGTVPLTAVTLTNNSTTTLVEFDYTQYKSAIVTYSFTRGAIYGTGSIWVASDGVTVAVSSAGAESAASGISFSGTISTGNIVVQGVLDSSGNDASVKYKVQRWMP
jgi:hypothetical protein